jgi:hypothetical protein
MTTRIHLKSLFTACLLFLIAVIPFEAVAQAPGATVLLTVTGTYDTWVNFDITTKLYSDGTIVTTYSPGIDPPNKELPDGAIPDSATPSTVNPDVGMHDDKDVLKEKIAAQIAGYLIGQWIKDLLSRLDEKEEGGEPEPVGD